jgi:hypothetical protein
MKGHHKLLLAIIVGVAFMAARETEQLAQLSGEIKALFGATDTISLSKVPVVFQSALGDLLGSDSRRSPKLFPLHLPIPSTFISDLPFEPWIDNSCRVEFKDSKMATLRSHHSKNAFEDGVGVDVAVRLLEHRFECKASHLAELASSTGHAEGDASFWVPPFSKAQIEMKRDAFWDGDASMNSTMMEGSGRIEGVLFLLPFVFSSFFAPTTCRKDYSLTICFIANTADTVNSGIPLGVKNITLDQNWRTVLEQARRCDFIASDSREGLVVADSLGVPGLATVANLSSRHQISTDRKDILRHNLYSPPRQNPRLGGLERHDLHRAQAIVETFPFHLFTTKCAKGPVVSSDRADATNRNNSTLVIVLGNLRGGEKTWHSMYKHLLDENDADLALMIGEGSDTSFSPHARAKYVWEFPEYDDWADAIDLVDKDNVTNWRVTVEGHVMKNSGILGGVKGHIGSGAVIFMARHWLIEIITRLNLTERYDRFVLTRSDYYYSCSHPLAALDSRYLWVPTGEDYGGVTDRHWVLNRYHLLPSLRIFHNLILHHTNLFCTPTMGGNPELLIRFAWTMENLFPHQVRRFPRMMYTAFIDGVDGTRWKNQKKKWGLSEHGVLIKYVSEHTFASCFCGGGHVFDYKGNRSVGDYTDSWQTWTCMSNTSTRL